MHAHWAPMITMLELTALVFVPYLVATCVYVLLTTPRAERVSMLKWSLAIGVSAFLVHIGDYALTSFAVINLIPWWLYHVARFIVFGGFMFVAFTVAAYFIDTPPHPRLVYRWSFVVFSGFWVMFLGLDLRFGHMIPRWLGVVLFGVGLALLLTTGAELFRAAWYARVTARREQEKAPEEQADPSLRSG